VKEDLTPELSDRLSPLESAGLLESRLNVRLFEVDWRQDEIALDAPSQASTGADLQVGPAHREPPPRRAPAPPVSAGDDVGLELDTGPREVDLSPSHAAARRQETVPVAEEPQPAEESRLRPPAATGTDSTSALEESQVASLHADAAVEGRSLCMICNGNIVTVSNERPVASMGRDSENDVKVAGQTVSRHHARVEWRKGDFFLVDHSANGTFMYDERGTEYCIQNDEAKLGPSGAICPGCPQETPEAEVMLFWIADDGAS
jgi:pSer/pThr/pTyr-binding forkhead associated (FHA) protein